MCPPSFTLTALSSILLLASKCHTISITSLFDPTSAETASAQFSILIVIPISFFFPSPRSKTQKVLSCSLVALLLLCGDIHLNPGPGSNSFKICTLNSRSLLNPLKYTSITDLAKSRHIDLFALTETWITSSTGAELSNATPPSFTLISCLTQPQQLSPTLLAGAQHFSFVNLLLFFLHQLKPSSHLKCLLSLSNSSDLI